MSQSRHKWITSSYDSCDDCIFTDPWPIGSMYGISTYIYHTNQPNVGKSTIHGSYGWMNGWYLWKTYRYIPINPWIRQICPVCPNSHGCPWSLIKVKGTVNLGVKTGDVRLEVRINGLYPQYTPFIGIVENLLPNHLPTSWDIQVRGFWN